MFRLILPNHKSGGEDLLEVLSTFLNTRKISDCTKRQYKTDLRVFSSYLNIDLENHPEKLSEVSRRDVIRFFNWQIAQPGLKVDGIDSGISPATVNRRVERLRKLYRRFEEEGLIEKNPFPDELGLLEAEQKMPTRALPSDMVTKLLDSPGSDVIGIRDKALLETLFGCGLRIGDILKLKLEQFDSKAGCFLQCETKGKRQYFQRTNKAISARAVKALQELIAIREAQFAYPDTFIFKSYRGGEKRQKGHMDYKTAVRIFKKYIKAIGLNPSEYSPHSARATTITQLLNQGYSHRDIQQFSGHSSVRMVEYYDKKRTGLDDDLAKKLEF